MPNDDGLGVAPPSVPNDDEVNPPSVPNGDGVGVGLDPKPCPLEKEVAVGTPRTDIVSFPRPNNTSNDSYSDNDKQGDSDSDDFFLGGINLKWSLFFLGNKIGSSFCC